ncbi:hypothetical protein BS329_09740 [Amycolatopsis coloradensis]|uniref:Pentapeptide repeat-containing protein n=1 Tax=Amycolatopsis coloradensis TaxID=76021 RepID=A0A1R0KVR5_9PSEU|nr:hypothetical protein [Amycolatopsis coloradensis]OLZ53104.1 hypothetical protein BS329_09740 [Amycolatopsis coloradensis]
MTQTYVKEKFEYRKIIESAATFTDLAFEQCAFVGGVIMQEHDDPTYPLALSNISLHKCKVGNVVLYGLRCDNVVVDTLSHGKPIEFEACVFDRVTFRGSLGAVRFSPAIDEEPRKSFAPGAAKLYEEIDWALDITEAEFSDIEIWDVPGHLVKRDPETQFLVRRATAAAADIDALPPYARVLVERAAEAPYDTSVLAAPIRSKSFEEALDALRTLRDLGIAE